MAGFTVRSRGISEGRGATPAVPNGSPLNADKRFYAALPPYNVKADGRTLTDAALSLAGAVSSPSYTFTQADVGKRAVYVYGASTTAHLYTTIASVSAGQAQLAASGVAVASGEFFFASDDTVGLLAVIGDAGAVNGGVVLPWGDIGISGVLSSAAAVALHGCGVIELYGGLTAQNDANFPTIAPYLKGTVIVQCSANTDIIDFTTQGRSQTLIGVGLRFAGRYANTGHGVNASPTGGRLGNIGGVLEDVRVFGHDGNHYAFIVEAPELMRWTGLRSYGGGGLWLRNNATVPGPPGNITCTGCYMCTYINGTGHAWLLDASAAVSLGSLFFADLEGGVRVPNPAITGTTAPQGTTQKPLQTLAPTAFNQVAFVTPGLESDTGSTVVFPQGPGCIRTSDPTATVGNPGMSTSPASGVGVQNLLGKDVQAVSHFVLAPAGTATASTTLSAQANAGATTVTVTSATGFAVGDGIQIDTAGNTEFAVISSVAGNVLTLVESTGFGLSITHASGATVQNGAAVIIGQTSLPGTFPGTQKLIWEASAIGAPPSAKTVALLVPSNWTYRLDWKNATRMWTDYATPSG